MKYRSEIDGLRTLAILPVILFHLNFKQFSGGYVGVDIFFVISGFLISTIILDELENANFSLINFYIRRARRILPALFFVLFISILFSWLLLQPHEFIKFHKSLFSVLTFSSNIFFWKDGDYFFTESSLKPLLHTWSLAVEEQFYLFFPFILIFIKKFNKKTAFYILLFITISSLIFCQIMSLNFKSANFYLLPTRFWELSLGAIAAIKINDFKESSNVKRNEIFGIVGLILILISIFIFDENTPFPSFLTLFPTVGTFLVIIFVSKDNKISYILSNKIFVKLGLLSYSAYLFHQPLIAFSKIYFEEDFGSFLKYILLLLTFLLAYFSFKFIELPFKNSRKISKNGILVLFITFFLAYSTYSILIFKFCNFPFEFDLAKKISNSKVISITNMDERIFNKYRIEYYKENPDILILGSSRIMQFASSKSIGKVFNLSVSGASIEDIVTFGVLATQKFTPKTIYLSADPWLFNENSGQIRWLSIKDEFDESLRLIMNPDKYKLNFSEFNKIDTNSFAFNLYKRFNIKYSKIDLTDTLPGLYNKKRYDGSMIYNIHYSNRELKDISNDFNDLISYSMYKYNFNSDRYKRFELLIDYFKVKRINVKLFFSPYHPLLYPYLAKDTNFLFSKHKFIQLAKKHSISIVGSYNPDECGCNIADFYDGMHPKDACINKIITHN
jgi:peptidoglycan/LPS O-acetylase OafA/YrhL